MAGYGFDRSGLAKREKLLFSSLSADLKSLFDWLLELGVINHVESLGYSEDPTAFFKELRKGYILSKLSIAAIASQSTFYCSQINSSPQTRYIEFDQNYLFQLPHSLIQKNIYV